MKTKTISCLFTYKTRQKISHRINTPILVFCARNQDMRREEKGQKKNFDNRLVHSVGSRKHINSKEINTFWNSQIGKIINTM